MRGRLKIGEELRKGIIRNGDRRIVIRHSMRSFQVRQILSHITAYGIAPPKTEPPARLTRLNKAGTRIDCSAVGMHLGVVALRFPAGDVRPIVFHIGFDTQRTVLAVTPDTEFDIQMRVDVSFLIPKRSANPPFADKRSRKPRLGMPAREK